MTKNTSAALLVRLNQLVQSPTDLELAQDCLTASRIAGVSLVDSFESIVAHEKLPSPTHEVEVEITELSNGHYGRPLPLRNVVYRFLVSQNTLVGVSRFSSNYRGPCHSELNGCDLTPIRQREVIESCINRSLSALRSAAVAPRNNVITAEVRPYTGKERSLAA